MAEPLGRERTSPGQKLLEPSQGPGPKLPRQAASTQALVRQAVLLQALQAPAADDAKTMQDLNKQAVKHYPVTQKTPTTVGSTGFGSQAIPSRLPSGDRQTDAPCHQAGQQGDEAETHQLDIQDPAQPVGQGLTYLGQLTFAQRNRPENVGDRGIEG